MFDAMEEMIRQYPEQWEMFRRFWPEGDDACVDERPPRRLPAGTAV